MSGEGWNLLVIVAILLALLGGLWCFSSWQLALFGFSLVVVGVAGQIILGGRGT